MLDTRFDNRIKRYSLDFEKYGYDSKTMAMPSDRRTIRYEELIKNFTFYKNKDEQFTLFDAGCGFGDLVKYLDHIGCSRYKYIGVDVVDEFLKYARGGFTHKENLKFDKFNFLTDDLGKYKFDYAVSSQTFNDLYSDAENNMDVIIDSIGRLFRHASKGVSFNFVTDRVQFRNEGVAYHSPIEILDFVYSLTNSVVLDNSCMPYECTCTLLKDSASDSLVFDMFRNKHRKEFDEGTFVVKKKG